MKLLPDKMLRATFVARPNRFIVRCRLEDGSEAVAQMPNPGRLTELLLPGVTLFLEDHFEAVDRGKRGDSQPAAGRKKPDRRTRYTVWAVELDGTAVLLHTQKTNTVARSLLEEGRVPGLESARVIQAEVRHGRSRFDFLMEERGQRFFLEVKSVTLFGNGAALFPDAVTDRGRHHLLQLAELGDEAARQGLPRPVVLFLVHTARVNRFLPDYHTDLAFARAFLNVRDRIRILPVAIGWNRSLEIEKAPKLLPVPWEFLQNEVQDGGAYLFMLQLDRPRTITVGKLGRLDFEAGWYVYVGSAMANLTARMNRHLRRRKRFHWHIDFLRDQAAQVQTLPIRSSSRDECTIASTLSRTLEQIAPGFGCSDCCCSTHLYFSPEYPLYSRTFHEVLAEHRMKAPK